MPEFNLPPDFHVCCTGSIFQYVCIVKHSQYPLPCHHSHLQHIEFIGNHPKGAEQKVQQQDKRNNISSHLNSFFLVQLVGIPGSKPNQQTHGKGQNNLHHWKKNRIGKNGLDVGIAVLFVDGLKPFLFSFLGGKCLNNLHTREVLLHKSIQGSNGVSDIDK